MGRFVKVDLEQDEVEAVHALCDIANVMMRDLGSHIPPAARQKLQTSLNSVRYKMGAATFLFTGKHHDSEQNVITGLPAMLSLELAKRRGN